MQYAQKNRGLIRREGEAKFRKPLVSKGLRGFLVLHRCAERFFLCNCTRKMLFGDVLLTDLLAWCTMHTSIRTVYLLKMLKTAENTENGIRGFHKFIKTGQDYRNEAYPW